MSSYTRSTAGQRAEREAIIKMKQNKINKLVNTITQANNKNYCLDDIIYALERHVQRVGMLSPTHQPTSNKIKSKNNTNNSQHDQSYVVIRVDNEIEFKILRQDKIKYMDQLNSNTTTTKEATEQNTRHKCYCPVALKNKFAPLMSIGDKVTGTKQTTKQSNQITSNKQTQQNKVNKQTNKTKINNDAKVQNKVKWIELTLRGERGGLSELRLSQIQHRIKQQYEQNKVKQYRITKGTLHFKVRDDLVHKLQDFSFGKHHLKVEVKRSPAKKLGGGSKGLTSIPYGETSESFISKIKDSNKEIIESASQLTEIKGGKIVKMDQIIINFKTAEMPINITGSCSFVTPTMLKTLKCGKCQMPGHKTKHCRGEVACPRCAGLHSLAQCTTGHIQCANCAGSHWANFKKCPMFMNYVGKIKENNNNIYSKYLTRLNAIKEQQKQNIKDFEDSLPQVLVLHDVLVGNGKIGVINDDNVKVLV